MRIGVIANMKAGLEHFVFRELHFFSTHGISIDLFPTRLGPGLYSPPEEWRLHKWNPFAVILWQFYFFACAPIRYLTLLRRAVRYRALVDYALAWYFSPNMKDLDVLYATFGDHKLFIGYFAKLILNKPLAVTVHAYELYNNPNPHLFAEALKACDQVITVSIHNQELLAAQYGLDPAQIQVVRYSVDLEEYHPTQKFVILIVSFFTYRKGHEILLKAVKQLNRDDIEIWIVGDAAGRQGVVDVRKMVKELGMEAQVAFFGSLSGTALKAVYRSCDLFCLPSRRDQEGAYEGFPNVLIEAMACGKPVISTRHAEIPRIIPSILVDENDIEALAQAIEQVYQSASLREQLSIQNRQIAETYFSPKNAHTTVTLLHRLARMPSNSLEAVPDALHGRSRAG